MGSPAVTLKKPIGGICIAAILWAVMFSPFTAPYINFWVMMTCSAIVLTCYSSWAYPQWYKDIRFSTIDIFTGILLAVALWGVFWIGDKLSSIMFDFARPQVNAIYGMKEGENPYILTALMLLIIGPAEEIFWRGFVQKRLSARWSPNIGFILTTLVYGLVHLPRLNFMLVMAAMVAGFVWGLAYRLFPERLGAIIISHALWDCAVFIWFPI